MIAPTSTIRISPLSASTSSGSAPRIPTRAASWRAAFRRTTGPQGGPGQHRNTYCTTLARYSATFAKEGEVLWEGATCEQRFLRPAGQGARTQPEVIFLLITVTTIIKQARKIGIDATFVGGDGWDPIMVDYAGSALDGAYYTETWHRASPSERSRRFVAAYEKHHGEAQSALLALSYDAVQIVADALRRSPDFDRATLRAAIATADIEGVSGRITFDAQGDPLKAAVMLRFVDGQEVFHGSFAPDTGDGRP